MVSDGPFVGGKEVSFIFGYIEFTTSSNWKHPSIHCKEYKHYQNLLF